MTHEDLTLQVLQRRHRRTVYNSRPIAEALGISHESLLKKIKNLKCDAQFKAENFVDRPYTGPDTNHQVYFDIFTPGVMLLLAKSQKDDFRIALIEKLLSLL